MKQFLLICLAAIFFVADGGLAMERFDIVSTRELKQLLEDRAAGKMDFTLANTLDRIIFRHASIPGSVNTPWCDPEIMANRLGSDRNKLIITY